MALRGVQRSTIGLDFILMLEDLEKAEAIFSTAGYRRAFHNQNVSHYISDRIELGRIDILHAFRGPTLSMLERCDRIKVEDGCSLPVVQIEDIIGLKIQAAHNDPRRNPKDWQDIQMILAANGQQTKPIDWNLITNYLQIFKIENKLHQLKIWYHGTTP